MILEIAFHKKTSFSKMLNVRIPYESSSRIRVGEGSPKEKKKERKKNLKTKLPTPIKKGLEKVRQTTLKKHQQTVKS